VAADIPGNSTVAGLLRALHAPGSNAAPTKQPDRAVQGLGRRQLVTSAGLSLALERATLITLFAGRACRAEDANRQDGQLFLVSLLKRYRRYCNFWSVICHPSRTPPSVTPSPVCASLSSERCWPRPLNPESCKVNWQGWARAFGAIPLLAWTSRSPPPPWSAGITPPGVPMTRSQRLRTDFAKTSTTSPVSVRLSLTHWFSNTVSIRAGPCSCTLTTCAPHSKTCPTRWRHIRLCAATSWPMACFARLNPNGSQPGCLLRATGLSAWRCAALKSTMSAPYGIWTSTTVRARCLPARAPG